MRSGAEGWSPFLLVGVAGSTSTTAESPLASSSSHACGKLAPSSLTQHTNPPPSPTEKCIISGPGHPGKDILADQ